MREELHLKKILLSKKIIYIDMDGVIVDLRSNIRSWFKNHPNLVEKYKNYPDHIPGIFRNPKPIPNAVYAINELYNSKKYEMFIATSSPWGNPSASTDKRFWIEENFGNMFHKKMFLTHRKDLLMGDYLIDDRLKNGAESFKGELIRFGFDDGKWNKFKDWGSVLNYLI